MKKISRWNPMILILSTLEKIAYRSADKIVTTLENSQSYINSIIDDPKKRLYIYQMVSLSHLLKTNPSNLQKKPLPKKIITYGSSFGL